MVIELPDDLYKRITALCQEGDAYMKHGNADAALERFHAAWHLLPEPKNDWEAGTWVFSAIGDAWYSKGDHQQALLAFQEAVQCPDGLGNPFIHLRLGECYFEMGDSPKAQDELTRAYMGGGREIFEEEDPKYFAFLKGVLKPPQGQSEL
jgi:tetratricopeptide (TPR) repeat protein